MENTFILKFGKLSFQNAKALSGVCKTAMLVLSLFTAVSLPAQTIRYVKSGASGNGSSWANASDDIQAMINLSGGGDQVWVAAGTYKPTHNAATGSTVNPADTDNAFVMKTDVAVYGSFAGTETDISQRNIVANPTILSGDFNNDDVITGGGSTLSVTGNSEDAVHIVLSSGTTNSTLDGFTITGGNATSTTGSTLNVGGTTTYRAYGGGVQVSSGSINLTNCTIYGNSAGTSGGGVALFISSATVTNCNVGYNLANSSGGGLHNSNTVNTLTIINSNISNNSAMNGGAIFNGEATTLTVTNTELNSNSSIVDGGVVWNNGFATFVNSLLSGNRSGHYGGAAYNVGDNKILTFINSTITDNSATEYGGGIFQLADIFNVRNSIIWNNTAPNNPNIWGTITAQQNSLVQDVNNTGDGNINGTNASLIVFNDTVNGDYSLAENSPLVDAGNNTVYTDAGGNLVNDKDLAGNPRLFGSNIDLGAYEFTTMAVSDVAKTNISIYPNPFHNILKISDIESVKSISVMDMSGRLVKILAPATELNFSDLKENLYIINLLMKDGSVKTVKVIKN